VRKTLSSHGIETIYEIQIIDGNIRKNEKKTLQCQEKGVILFKITSMFD